jgi:class 3 adenylate cyclase
VSASLSAGVAQLRTMAIDDAAVDAFAYLVGHGADREIVRINPVRFAGERGLNARSVVDMFLHTRKIGLTYMEWLFVCHGCGEIVDSLASLTAASSHFFCDVCSADRQTDMTEYVEVAFTVSPTVRRSSFHDPWSLDPVSHFLEHRFDSNTFVGDRSVADHLRSCMVACHYVDQGEAITIEVNAAPGYLWFTNGPALEVRPALSDDWRTFDFEYTGTHTTGFRATIDAGPVRIRFSNRTSHRYALMVVNLPGEYETRRGEFLSGADVLSNQTFLDLFETETVVASEGLGVARLAFLFTDLEGSTAMYDQLGDMRAFDLVRVHFGFLRHSVGRHFGALVKTIGDAVMATFVNPADAVRSALDMLARIERFNEVEGEAMVRLKVGIHWGACLAVTLNDRLDYFGQTVNLAARVQALAHANEIVISDDLARQPDVAEILAGLHATSEIVQVKGIDSDVVVHRLTSAQW